MLKLSIETSIFASGLNKIGRVYSYLKRGFDGIYKDSHAYRLVNGFGAKIKTFFRYSFLGRNAEIRQGVGHIILENSYVAKYTFSLYKKCKAKIINYLRMCLMVEALRDLKTELYFSPIKTISIFMVIATAVNVVLCFIFKRPIGIWGYLMRGLFLFVGIPGIYCKADWSAVKANSIFFKKVN